MIAKSHPLLLPEPYCVSECTGPVTESDDMASAQITEGVNVKT